MSLCAAAALWQHLQEDVLYALSQDDALKDLQVGDTTRLTEDSMRKMLYLLTPVGSSTETLSYLRSVYNAPGQPRTQWANFVERVRDMAAAQGIRDVPKAVNEVGGGASTLEHDQFETIPDGAPNVSACVQPNITKHH